MRVAVATGGGFSRPAPWKATAEAGEEEGQPPAPAPAPTIVGRKKGAAVGVRAWLAVNAAGEARVVEAGKHAIMRRTGLPARDLRILDPQLSYPSTVLGRERAIVINLEQIKAVITAHEVLVLNFHDPAVTPFLNQLQRRLHLHSRHLHQSPQIEEPGDGSDAYELEELRSMSKSPPESNGKLDNGGEVEEETDVNKNGKGLDTAELANSSGFKVLPFEFIALEACLEAACSCLEEEATSLENEAHPALDTLTSKISALNLEHVRQIKSRLVAITGRVQKVRDELEQLLDDDEDMAEMYLTDKLSQQQQSNGSTQSSPVKEISSINEERILVESSSGETDIQNCFDNNNLISEAGMILGDGHGSQTFSTRSSNKHLDVEELEMLLEAYFVQIDSTLNKLSTLREYVDDTEDYINIMLDDKQNHLLQMGVILTTATLIVSAFVVLVGIFGMNINTELFDENKAGMPEFLLTVGGGATGSLLLYVVAIAWCKHRRLVE
ncbi:Magnesium transporter MRS2-3 [Apostasia shenzhenica]|uniref:Magnesium transporter n=1 Tax=Apostasia shenzhenica TaxID=1088818 RepID=A0A2I0AFE3_9ASPA|nr:Magnesium transporter MRS2-3 [Apostasia shenzhenica]